MFRVFMSALVVLGLAGGLPYSQLRSEPPQPGPVIDEFVQARLRDAAEFKSDSRTAYGTFFRRLHLDLAGTPPTADDVQRFVKAEPKQRAAMVNRLVADALAEKRWKADDEQRVRDVLLEMLLGLDQ